LSGFPDHLVEGLVIIYVRVMVRETMKKENKERTSVVYVLMMSK